MIFFLFCLSASISVVLGVWPPVIEPRLLEIKHMKIKVEMESKGSDETSSKYWFSAPFDVLPGFVGTDETNRLVINARSICKVMQELQTKARVDMEKAAIAKMEKAATVNMKKIANVVEEQLSRVQYFVQVISYNNGSTINAQPEISFQKMFLPINFFYYFKLEDGKKFKDGEILQLHDMMSHNKYDEKLRNVLKDGKDQVEIERDPMNYRKITLRDGTSIEIDPIFGVDGPYFGCDIASVK